MIPQQRIKDEALKIFPTQMHSVQHGAFCDLNEYPRELWIAGATAENTRAQGLVDALEEAKKRIHELCMTIIRLGYTPFNPIGEINQALAKWKGEGEEPQEMCGICKEKPVGKDITVCNDCYYSFDGDRRGFWKGDAYQ